MNLQEWDERALGAYYVNNALTDSSLDLYCFHKTETRDPRPRSDPQYQPDRRIETAGARFVRTIAPRWTVTGEGAAQWGSQFPGTPIRAWAASGQTKRTFDRRFHPYAVAGYWALSGDDPSKTNLITGWDPLFARWPKWADLDAYTEFAEKGPGYATNIKRVEAGAGLSPFNALACRFEYYRLTAFHPMGRNPNVFASGLTRGDSLQLRLDFLINHELRGHLTFQTLAPGDFYAHRDRAWFLRFELLLRAARTVKRNRGDTVNSPAPSP